MAKITVMAGRWLVDICKTEAIYQPLTHYPTTRYTHAGRYGGFFLLTISVAEVSGLRHKQRTLYCCTLGAAETGDLRYKKNARN